ncbi:hypothetical protein Ancab_028623 [Ancistrocladus abbreviatus]
MAQSLSGLHFHFLDKTNFRPFPHRNKLCPLFFSIFQPRPHCTNFPLYPLSLSHPWRTTQNKHKPITTPTKFKYSVMDNFSYHSYPDSGNSSPRSRELDCDNIQPASSSWVDDPPQPNSKVKFLCSYGGKIQPRPHDNQLSYIGGDTKIFSVDRTIKFTAMLSKLSSLSDSSPSDICFKYQLPGEDFDALISVTNDEDIEHMMSEYDRLNRNSVRPARLRIFVFPLNPNPNSNLDDCYVSKPEGKWFVDALNSVQLRGLDIQSPQAPAESELPGNPDFLFGLEKGPNYEVTDPNSVKEEEAVVSIQRQMEKFQIGDNEFENSNDDAISDLNPRFYQAEYYKLHENVPPPPPPVAVPYWPERHMTASGYPMASGIPAEQRAPVYVLPTAAGVYHHQNPALTQVTGAPGQAYYNIPPRFGPEVYHEHPVYNPITPPPPLQSRIQQPNKVTPIHEEIGVVRQQSAMVAELGFPPVSYDSSGRPVYYTVAGGALAPPYQVVTTAVDDGRQSGGWSQESKPVGKGNQAYSM